MMSVGVGAGLLASFDAVEKDMADSFHRLNAQMSALRIGLMKYCDSRGNDLDFTPSVSDSFQNRFEYNSAPASPGGLLRGGRLGRKSNTPARYPFCVSKKDVGCQVEICEDDAVSQQPTELSRKRAKLDANEYSVQSSNTVYESESSSLIAGCRSQELLAETVAALWTRQNNSTASPSVVDRSPCSSPLNATAPVPVNQSWSASADLSLTVTDDKIQESDDNDVVLTEEMNSLTGGMYVVDALNGDNTSITASSSVTSSASGTPLPACHICGKRFRFEHTLISHLRSEHIEDQQSLNNNIQDLLTYSAGKTGVARPHACHICGKRFINAKNVKVHLENVHLGGREQAQFPCEYCGRLFHYKQNVQQHVRSVHQNMRYHCDSCDKVYVSKECLQKHMQRRHVCDPTDDRLRLCYYPSGGKREDAISLENSNPLAIEARPIEENNIDGSPFRQENGNITGVKIEPNVAAAGIC